MTPITKSNNSENTLRKAIIRLLEYCKENDWAGYDPYDALNSKIFSSLPFLDFRIFRLVFTQALKRSPVTNSLVRITPAYSNQLEQYSLSILVLGLQLPLANKDDSCPSRCTEPCLHLFCRQRTTGCI